MAHEKFRVLQYKMQIWSRHHHCQIM